MNLERQDVVKLIKQGVVGFDKKVKSLLDLVEFPHTESIPQIEDILFPCSESSNMPAPKDAGVSLSTFLQFL